MEDLHITEDSVQKMLEQLDPNKSPGLDGIHPRFLNETAETLCVPLKTLFQHSVNTGTAPYDWKDANICAIFKKGDTHDAGNYRSISLTSVVSKLLEKIIRNHLMNHMSQNNLFFK